MSSAPSIRKVLSTRFDDYTRTAKLEQQLQDGTASCFARCSAVADEEVRDWVGDELQNYAKVAQTTMRVRHDLPHNFHVPLC